MKFIKYESKEKFLEENLEILLQEEAKNEIMIGITLEHEIDKTKKWLLGRIEKNNEVKAIFLIEDDRKGLLIYSLEENTSDEVINCLVDNIIALKIDIKEVLTSKESAIKISEIYSRKMAKKMYINQEMYILKFDKIREEYLLNEGEIVEKLAETTDLKNIQANVKEMYQDNYRGRYCSDEEAIKVAKAFLKKGLYVLRNENNEIVSQAVTVRKQINGCAIGGVITFEKYRGHGYAKRLVYTLCEKLLKEGKKYIVLHVNPQNEQAISIYTKIGFDKIDETAKVKFI